MNQTPPRLPLWRLITGLGVLAILTALLVVAALVYVDNFRLDRYMRKLAAQPESATLQDPDLTARILQQAKQLDLPVRADDIHIAHSDGRPEIRIDRYTLQTKLLRLDLRMPAASSQ